MMTALLKPLLIPVAGLKAGKNILEKRIHNLVDKLIGAAYVVLGVVLGIIILAIL